MKVIILAALTLILTACASVGERVDLGALDAMEAGKTTKTEVREKLGSPTTTGINSEGESYFVYTFASSRIKPSTVIPVVGLFTGGATTDTQTLQMWFDTDDRLKHYDFNENTLDSRTGVGSR